VNEKYIELRTRSTFGDIINTYFLFLKHNFKTYTNLYLRYNAISIILALVCSYLLATGFMGLVSRDFRFGMDNNSSSDNYLIAGGIILVLVFFITTSINYSFSSAYIADYANHNGKVESKRIWKSIMSNIGTIIVFILIGAFLYLIYLFIAGVLSLIPLLGFFAQYGLNFTMSGIFGLTFMSIFSTKKGFSEAISEGFDFTFSNFWRIVLFGLVIGLLGFVFMMTLFQIPTYLMGIYVYFSVESGIDLTTSTVATLFFTLWFAIILIFLIYVQALSQIAYGILYYNLFEVKHNVFLQNKIDQIGINE